MYYDVFQLVVEILTGKLIVALSVVLSLLFIFNEKQVSFIR